MQQSIAVEYEGAAILGSGHPGAKPYTCHCPSCGDSKSSDTPPNYWIEKCVERAANPEDPNCYQGCKHARTNAKTVALIKARLAEKGIEYNKKPFTISERSSMRITGSGTTSNQLRRSGRALIVSHLLAGVKINVTAAALNVTRRTVKRYRAEYARGLMGSDGVFSDNKK